MALKWSDAQTIGDGLYDLDQNTHPLSIRFTDLHAKVLALDGFVGSAGDAIVCGHLVDSATGSRSISTPSGDRPRKSPGMSLRSHLNLPVEYLAAWTNFSCARDAAVPGLHQRSSQ
jgi:FeS assembly protein IscX